MCGYSSTFFSTKGTPFDYQPDVEPDGKSQPYSTFNTLDRQDYPQQMNNIGSFSTPPPPVLNNENPMHVMSLRQHHSASPRDMYVEDTV